MRQRKGKQEKSPVKLDRLEVDFSGCPPDEIYECWEYEFAREIDWLRQIVDRRRSFRTHGHQVDTLTPFARASWYSFLLRPDWPRRPYLSATPKERLKARRWTRLVTEQEQLARFLLPDREPNLERLAASIKSGRRPMIRSESQRLELALVRIDWIFTDTFLVDAFKCWLKEFRPIAPVTHNARTTANAIRKKELEDLGRYRLLRANNSKVRVAMAAAGLTKAKADPWYRARKAVDRILADADLKIVPRLSRSEMEHF